MKTYTVYFEIYGKKMKASGIEATNQDQAERIVRHKLNIMNIEEEPSDLEKGKKIILDGVKDIGEILGIKF